MAKAGAVSLLLAVILFCAPLARSQSSTVSDSQDRRPDSGYELELWTGGGGDPIGTPHVTLGNSIRNLGGRYGWVLTGRTVPGPCKDGLNTPWMRFRC